MPRGDGTGPWGRGPRTGRGAGYCAGNDVPGYLNAAMPPRGGFGMGRGSGRGFGRGMGQGRGFGGGRGHHYPDAPPAYGPGPVDIPPPVYGPAPAPEDEVTYLEGAAKQLGEELKAIKARIGELKKAKKE